MKSNSINRRELLTLAAASGAAALAAPLVVKAQSSDTNPPPAVAPTAAAAKTTPEGLALVDAAYAGAGYDLPADQVAEVRKQLSGYPGDFAKARKLKLDNGAAPIMGVTPPIAGSEPKPMSAPPRKA